jgi:hypothetical protein
MQPDFEIAALHLYTSAKVELRGSTPLVVKACARDVETHYAQHHRDGSARAREHYQPSQNSLIFFCVAVGICRQ